MFRSANRFLSSASALTGLVLLASCGSCGDETNGDGPCVEVELTSAYVEGGTTLPEFTCYFADNPVDVVGGDLIIERGVRIASGTTVQIRVAEGAKIVATGTEEDPIRFLGNGSDTWPGIQFSSIGGNSLDYVVIDSAGNKEWFGGGDADGSVYVEAGAALSIKNSVIQNGLGRGVLVADATFSLESTTITGCEVAGSVDPNVAGGIGADNTLTGNDDDHMILSGDLVTDEQTWNDIGIPWNLSERLIVRAPLTIDAGARVEAGEGVELAVTDDGRLHLAGTEEAPVVLAGEEDTPGYWKGVSVATSGQDNVFEFSEIANAGGGEWFGGSDRAASLYVPEGGSVVLKDTVIRGSANYGILATSGANLDGWSGVTFSSNKKVAILHPNLVHYVPADTIFDGNDEQGVRVAYGNTDAVSEDQTWQALDVPYLITVRTLLGAHLTIDAGAEVRFFQDASINVQAAGALTAAGTAGNEVVFTGLEETAGFWKGLQFESSTANNSLQNTRISYGGSSDWFGGGDAAANLYVTGSVELTDVTIDQGAGFGIILGNAGTVTCDGVTFDSNALGDVDPDTTVCM